MIKNEPKAMIGNAYSSISNPMIKAVRDLLKHWRNIFEIARENHKRGVRYISFREGVDLYKKFKAATR